MQRDLSRSLPEIGVHRIADTSRRSRKGSPGEARYEICCSRVHCLESEENVR